MAAAVLTLCAGAPVAADEAAEFYRGRTVAIVVGHEVGTGFDIYGRVLARHLGRHIPGNPAVVVQNMTGASGITAANWLYNAAPRDGTVMATFVHTVPFEPLFGNSAARFDPARLVWIGNMEESLGTCGVSPASGVATFEELRRKEVVFGATGATGPLSKFALALRNLLGAKIKLVHGYKGSASVKIAVQRGEVHGACALPISTLKSFWREELESGRFKPIIQLSGRRSAELADIPHVDDYASSEADGQLFGLIFGAQALGRIYGSPPEMPPARASALRRAFMATMEDAQFLEEARTAQIDIVPNTGEEVAALIARYSATSADVIERAKRAFDPN
jgi:tripartite-type tricarboxylate transporter receptor subunit TctC